MKPRFSLLIVILAFVTGANAWILFDEFFPKHPEKVILREEGFAPEEQCRTRVKKEGRTLLMLTTTGTCPEYLSNFVVESTQE